MRDKKIIIIVVLLLIVIGIGAVIYFKFFQDDVNTINTKNTYSKYKITSNELENFDLSFLKAETNNQNLIYSPLSIKYSLAMLSAGSKGQTKEQIDTIIGDYNFKKYINNSNMSFANAIFIRNIFKNDVKQDYIKILKNSYNAEVVYDDFDNADNINSWINNKTLGLIDNLIENINDQNFYLINALGINMEWNKFIQATGSDSEYSVEYSHENYSTHIESISNNMFNSVKFNNNTLNSTAGEIGASINNYDIVKALGENNIRETITQEYETWLKNPINSCGENEDTNTFVDNYIKELDSNYKKIDTSTDFKFYTDDDIKVFSKDLKEYNGTTLEYIGIMPKSNTLKDFIKGNDATSLSEIIKKLKTIELKNFEEGKVTKIIGAIPFFKYDYELKLVDDLKALGITNIFDSSKSDLSNIAKNAVIDDAKHKANIEFSNEGIKASAVTAAGGTGAASCGFEHLYDVPVVVIDMSFNNPYLYLIREKNSGEVWFIGTVYEPLENTNPSANIINIK